MQCGEQLRNSCEEVIDANSWYFCSDPFSRLFQYFRHCFWDNHWSWSPKAEWAAKTSQTRCFRFQNISFCSHSISRDPKTSFYLFVSFSPFSDAQKIKNQLEKIFNRVGRIGKTIIFSEILTVGAGYLDLQTPGFRNSKFCFVRLLEAFVSIPLCYSPSSLSHPTRETMRHANALSCNGKPPVYSNKL